MKLTKQQIIDIADNLDCGIKSYIHLKTGKIINIIDIESWEDAAEDFEEEDRNEIEENSDDYFEFEKMSSHTSFTIMEDFIQTIDNTSLQEKLVQVLQRPKPFGNFKWEIDNSGKYRQQWFDYKKERFIGYVEGLIEGFNVG